MRPILALAILALTTFALAGCSGSGGPVTPPTDDEGRYVIHMAASGNKFLPPSAKVPVGETVVWENDGATPHNVMADDGSFSSDTEFPRFMQKGDEFDHTFGEAGTFTYMCHLHSGMTGTIVVG